MDAGAEKALETFRRAQRVFAAEREYLKAELPDEVDIDIHYNGYSHAMREYPEYAEIIQALLETK